MRSAAWGRAQEPGAEPAVPPAARAPGSRAPQAPATARAARARAASGAPPPHPGLALGPGPSCAPRLVSLREGRAELRRLLLAPPEPGGDLPGPKGLKGGGRQHAPSLQAPGPGQGLAGHRGCCCGVLAAARPRRLRLSPPLRPPPCVSTHAPAGV